ncbi:hypothetical protein [Roseibacillus persicicus]|uniref:hypothetical protein n=1 Tax=Roseibacillus persicicus TaxID=454148 RepID=UPI00280CFE22|nr:hypothetical protein [Roseibacillus persicicus]MDQ8191572.1 hypothetical protein [Roseibacillus persicicus]
MNTIMTPSDGEEDGRHISDGEVNHHQLGEGKNDGTELTVPSVEGCPVDKNKPASNENSIKNGEDVTPNKGDIFDDLAALARPVDEIIPSEKVLTSLPMRKPKRDEWVRQHPEFTARVHIYESTEDRSLYVILPKCLEPLADVSKYVEMSLTMNSKGAPFIWPVPIPTERRAHQAHIDAFAAAIQARKEWIRTTWTGNEYETVRRKSAMPEPTWPAEITSPGEMLRFAAKSGSLEVIDSMDHPVIKEFLGIA